MQLPWPAQCDGHQGLGAEELEQGVRAIGLDGHDGDARSPAHKVGERRHGRHQQRGATQRARREVALESEELCEMLQGMHLTHARLVLRTHELAQQEREALDWRAFFAPVAALYAGAHARPATLDGDAPDDGVAAPSISYAALKSRIATPSVWTVDLAYVVRHFGVRFRFLTTTVGVAAAAVLVAWLVWGVARSRRL